MKETSGVYASKTASHRIALVHIRVSDTLLGSVHCHAKKTDARTNKIAIETQIINLTKKLFFAARVLKNKSFFLEKIVNLDY